MTDLGTTPPRFRVTFDQDGSARIVDIDTGEDLSQYVERAELISRPDSGVAVVLRLAPDCCEVDLGGGISAAPA